MIDFSILTMIHSFYKVLIKGWLAYFEWTGEVFVGATSATQILKFGWRDWRARLTGVLAAGL